MTTAPDTRVNVTANTGPQLSTKSWPEISKWHRMTLFSDGFQLQSGMRWFKSADPDHADRAIERVAR